MFDLAGYIRQNNISYIERGPNVQRDNINICCPLCGDDPSYHMGIHLRTGYWGCWRDPSHRGQRPDRLLRKLFGYSWDQIKKITGADSQVTAHTLDDLSASLAELEGKKVEPIESYTLPEEFKTITTKGYGAVFWEYLNRRGFPDSDISHLVEKYNLRYAVSGKWNERLVVPFYYQNKLVGWTGRAIHKAEVRYKNFPEGSQSKNIIFNYDRAEEGGRALVPVEGPFDALKVDFYGERIGLVSVAFLGVAVTTPQINMLAKISHRFDMMALLLDEDAVISDLSMTSSMAALKARSWSLPKGVHDPGEMTLDQVLSLRNNL